MAATRKKTTGAKNVKAKSSRSKQVSRSKASPTQPIRREVWGGVLLLLALCTLISYFGVSALFINVLAVLLKGMFGYGYWLACPSLLLAGYILLSHHGRPVTRRAVCALLVTPLFGSLTHILMCRIEYTASLRLTGELWRDGLSLQSGGAVSGTAAYFSAAVFSRLVSLILFAALLTIVLMIALDLTPRTLMEWYRNRRPYEYEPEPVPKRLTGTVSRNRMPPPTTRTNTRTNTNTHTNTSTRTNTSTAHRRRAVIDIPLDDEDELPKPRRTRKKPKPVPPVEEPAPEEELEIPEEPLEPVPAPEPYTVEEPPAVKEPEPVPPPEPKGKKEKALAEIVAAAATVQEEIQRQAPKQGENYVYPSLELLNRARGANITETGAELRNNSKRLSETLTSFGVNATPGDVIHGPSVTRYEFVLEQGVKLAKITNLSDDIALALGASGVRIAPTPDKISVVGIEVPNKYVATVPIRDVLASDAFTRHKSQVAFAVGKDINGECIVGDISTLPHVLIAGTTGSGKSVCTNSLIISLLYKSSPADVRFIMVDPKMVELAPYNGIPHLLIPVVTDPKKAAGALQWAVSEMMNRYKLFSQNGVKKLSEYNALAASEDNDLEHMAALVVVIDELADLMLVAAKEVEESICRVAQMGRAAGVHLVIATQRPSADVITGLMKANIPSRIAFAVASSLESRIILDVVGAEKLVGKGDMLYAPLGKGKPMRVQGCFIAPEEIDRVVKFVKQNGGEACYSDEVMKKIEESVKGKGGNSSADTPEASDEADELLPAAVDIILETGQASVSMLQRRLKLGYSHAARLVDQMEERGIVGAFQGSRPRQILITKEKWQEMKLAGVLDANAALPGGN